MLSKVMSPFSQARVCLEVLVISLVGGEFAYLGEQPDQFLK